MAETKKDHWLQAVWLAVLSLGLLLCCNSLTAGTISVSEGTNFSVAVSPDGQSLAIDVQGAIRVLPAAGGKARSLTPWTDDARLPQWSPDGHSIAYQSYRDGNWHIWIVNVAAGVTRQQTFGPYDDREPSWDADGKSIVFASDRAGNFDIWRVVTGSGKLQQITSSSDEEYAPAVRKDGVLAFVHRKSGWGAKSVIRVGQGEDFMTVLETSQNLTGLSWLPDGSAVTLFTYDDRWTASQTDLQMVSIAGGGITTLSGAEDVFPHRASWSGEGQLWYAADGHIKTREAGTSATTVVPFEVDLRIDASDYQRRSYNFFDRSPQTLKGIVSPVISPDGTTVAFAALGDIWLRQSNGISKRLMQDGYLDIDPSFSRDGTRILFASDRSGSMDIWQHELSSGHETRLTSLEGAQSMPELSPDGTRLIFASSGRKTLAGNTTIEMLNLETGNRTSVIDGTFNPGRVSFSPDGRLLALAVVRPASRLYREGVSVIRIVDPELGQFVDIEPQQSISLDQRGYNGPIWSPDGRHIAWTQAGAIWMLDVDQSGQPISAPKRLNDEISAHPSWSGDSKHIVYLAVDQLKQLDVVSGQSQLLKLDLTWSQDSPESSLVIRAGRVWDGESEAYLEKVDVLVDGNRIVDIVPTGQHKSKGRLIDASNQVLIPGLIDSHAHHSATTGERLGRNWLAYGVTTVRSPGSLIYEAIERKESWASGQRPGPRLFYTGGLLDGSRVYYGIASSLSDEMVEQAIDQAVRLNYDLVKTYVRLPNDMQQRIVALAHARGLPVATHELYPAAGYGVDAKEHLKGTARDGFGSALTLGNRSYDDVISILAESGMTETPTLALLGGFGLVARQHPEILQSEVYKALYTEEERRDFSEGFLELYFGNKSTEFLIDVIRTVQQDLRRKLDRGVYILAGTDSPFIPYGLSLHVEISLYTGEEGLRPREALMTATSVAADALNVGEQLGRIRKGMVADMVIINGDPLSNVMDTLNIDAVVSNGRYFTVDELTRETVSEGD